MSMQFPGGGSNDAPMVSDNMPKLSGGLTRGLNKMALAYVAIVGVSVIGMTMWVASSAFSADDEKAQIGRASCRERV